MRTDAQPPESEPSREWTCGSCHRPVFRVVGVAAVIEQQVHFWVSGYCREHEVEIRESLEARAREGQVPEILLAQQLRPADVRGWMARLRREAAAR